MIYIKDVASIKVKGDGNVVCLSNTSRRTDIHHFYFKYAADGDVSMKKALASMIILSLMAVYNSAAVWSADAVTDAARVERQSASLAALQKVAATVGSYELKSIKVHSKAHQMLVTVIDSNLNSASVADREVEASKIADAIAIAITDKAEFSQIAVIHVDYTKIQDQLEKIVQGFDFYKSNTGTFSLHKT